MFVTVYTNIHAQIVQIETHLCCRSLKSVLLLDMYMIYFQKNTTTALTITLCCLKAWSTAYFASEASTSKYFVFSKHHIKWTTLRLGLYDHISPIHLFSPLPPSTPQNLPIHAWIGFLFKIFVEKKKSKMH